MGERESQQAIVRRVESATSVRTLSSANFHRMGFIIHNDSAAILYVKFGAGASATDFTHRMTAQASLEHRAGRVYRGIVTGFWETADGAAQVSELL